MSQPIIDVTNSDPLNFFRGGGEMGARMRAYNWETHPLGNPVHWPQSLKTNIRLLLNSAFPMFIWWSPDFYMFHNDAYLPALGKKHPQALGAQASEIWAEIWGQVGSIAKSIMQTGEEFYTEDLPLFLYRKGFLEETYWTFSYSAAFDDAGNISGIFCACFEVTNNVLRQRRLKSLKDISDAVSQIHTLEQAGQSICDMLVENKDDVPFSLIYLFNQPGMEASLLGKTNNITSLPTPELVNLLDDQTAWSLAEVHKTKQLKIIKLPDPIALPHDGVVAKEAAIIPIFRPGQDQLVGFFISGISSRLEYSTDYQEFHELLATQMATSITSVQAREEKERQQQYLNAIFQQAPVGIAIARGPQYILELANPSVCEIWGRRPEQLIGKPVVEALPEVADQGIIQLLDSVFQTGIPFVANELPVQLERNGQMETVYLNFVYHPIRDVHGNIIAIIAIAISINEQVKARQEIESMNRELLAINADLDNFVYSASHDLKAPIANIEALMNALLEYFPTDVVAVEDVQKLVQHIHASINRFKRTVFDLTQVTRIQREAHEDIASVPFADVIADVKSDFEPIINNSGVIIETNMAPNSTIRFSAKNIRSVVYNLVSNALKYRSPHRVPQILISTEHTTEYLILSVSDNGLGVEAADQDKMFQMFKRLHDHVEGSGIGLYIVKRIVENAGGKIEVESQLNQGTTFKIYLKK